MAKNSGPTEAPTQIHSPASGHLYLFPQAPKDDKVLKDDFSPIWKSNKIVMLRRYWLDS